MKLSKSDNIFLEDVASNLENGKNLEQSLFSIEYMPKKVLFSLQLGNKIVDILKLIDFENTEIVTLLSSLSLANTDANIQRLRTTAKLIEKRNEILEEKTNILRIHKRRMKIIRYVTLIAISIIAGIAPLFTGISSFIRAGEINYSFSLLNSFSVSFLLINLLNNYFLLKMSKETRIKIKLILVFIFHNLLVILIRIFFLNYLGIEELLALN